jgi:hypothetical protein
MSSANSSVSNSMNPSKRNIANRKFYMPPQPGKVLANGNNHNISNNSTPAPTKAKDFVIKQKLKREPTN